MNQCYNHIRFPLVLLSVLLLLTLTGCWSSNEIEELGLTSGMALDTTMKSTIESEIEEQGGGYPKKDLLTLTIQFINPQPTGSGNKGGGQQQKPYTNVSETGDSVHQITRELALRRDRPVFGQHLKVIVISADLVHKYSLQQLLDQILNDNEIRPSCQVFISGGRASETLELKEKGTIPSYYMIGKAENEYRTTKILPPMSLAKLTGKMYSESSFLLQKVIAANGEVKFAGAAVINGKTKKLLGFLNETETEGLTWITGKGKGGLVKSFDNKTGLPFIYEVISMKSRITSHVDENNISFDVNIESEGRLSENWVITENPSDNEFLKRAEEAAEKEVKRLMKNTVNTMQKQYQADVAGFGNRLRIEHPKVWEKEKNDWDQTFSEVPIHFKVKLTIKDYGSAGSDK